MKYKFLIFIFFLTSYFLLFTSVQSAYAHVLKTDGTIGAVLHVSPDDDPIVNEPTELFFDIKDKSDQFSPRICECKGIVMLENREVYSTLLYDRSELDSKNAGFSYTFEEKGIYKVRITGKPIDNAEFDSFDLAWDVRVAREKDSDDKTNNELVPDHRIHFLLVLLATFFVMIFIIKDRKRR